MDVVKKVTAVGLREGTLVERLIDGEMVGRARTNAARKTRHHMSSRKSTANEH